MALIECGTADVTFNSRAIVMRGAASVVLVSAFLAILCSSSLAASLEVSPVSVEVTAPAAAATMTLRNDGQTPLNAQIRVFRWVEADGEERLEPTDEFVASPPMTTLASKVDYTVRLVRVTKRPISSGESYRVLVDELPAPRAQQHRVVTLVMRYSVPVFFYPPDATDGKLTWSAERRDGSVYLSATNTGDRHVRISALKVQDGKMREISFGDGLAGYVLGHSTRRWPVPRNVGGLSDLNSLLIIAQSNYGPIRVSPTVPPGL
jgi:fimbrial chaperone protein